MTSKTRYVSGAARRIREAGIRMYGPRWMRSMAAAMGISPTLLSLMMSGKRPISTAIDKRVLAAFEHRRKELRKANDDLELAIRYYRSTKAPGEEDFSYSDEEQDWLDAEDR